MTPADEYAAEMATPENQAKLGVLMECAKSDIRFPKLDDAKMELILALYEEPCAGIQS